MYVTKFFGAELGSLVSCDAKNDKYIVNGAHDAEKLQSSLDGFITKFVLCPSCQNPETRLVFSKNNVMRDCKACGAIKPIDMGHKISTYIMKNPPVDAKANKKKSKANDALPTPETTSNPSDEEQNDEELTKMIEEEAEALPTADHYNDDDWAEDTTPEAVAARMKELAVGGAVEKLVGEDDDLMDPLDTFADYVIETPNVTAAQVKAKAEEWNLRDDKVCAVLVQILFDKTISAKIVESKAPYFEPFLTSEKAYKALLGGIERLVGEVHKELLPKIAMILKFFYDADLLEEDAILGWAEKPSRKFVSKTIAKEIRSKAEPFFKWLREAEEDDSE
jgi:translation initiation factor 5